LGSVGCEDRDPGSRRSPDLDTHSARVELPLIKAVAVAGRAVTPRLSSQDCDCRAEAGACWQLVVDRPVRWIVERELPEVVVGQTVASGSNPGHDSPDGDC